MYNYDIKEIVCPKCSTPATWDQTIFSDGTTLSSLNWTCSKCGTAILKFITKRDKDD